MALSSGTICKPSPVAKVGVDMTEEEYQEKHKPKKINWFMKLFMWKRTKKTNKNSSEEILEVKEPRRASFLAKDVQQCISLEVSPVYLANWIIEDMTNVRGLKLREFTIEDADLKRVVIKGLTEIYKSGEEYNRKCAPQPARQRSFSTSSVMALALLTLLDADIVSFTVNLDPDLKRLVYDYIDTGVLKGNRIKEEK